MMAQVRGLLKGKVGVLREEVLISKLRRVVIKILMTKVRHLAKEEAIA
jgi:hypothetical protein